MAFFWVLPFWYPTPKILPEKIGWETQQIDSMKMMWKASSKPLEKIAPILTVQLFEFNPNELSAEGWKKLGLRDKTVQTILHYREKGGRFRVPEDLKKIWGLSSTEANKLMPYVQIPELKKKVLELPMAFPKVMPATILINQATVTELLLIPGFTKSLAARMIKFRDKLGGFKSLEQVRKTYGLNDSLFQSMAAFVVFE
jgi:DNA uptake protein ComE-like DNA-binding protein